MQLEKYLMQYIGTCFLKVRPVFVVISNYRQSKSKLVKLEVGGGEISS
jgi:hypothetical protein